MQYEAKKVEKKWQTRWAEQKLYEVNLKSKKPKYYSLVMFPYPSGDKLHVGHWYNYGPADSYARYMKMKGFNVFEPMGFDSFGLPAENYAIKTGSHPRQTTEKNVEYMRTQLREMGTMYDWSKEVVTSHPDYYKWTQWVFLELYKKGLAYRREAPVNWCPKCQTVLANEQVKEGFCERCDSEVTQKNLTQWFFNIKKYAEDFLDFDGLDWPEKTKLMQENWIGKSEGITWTQKIKDLGIKIEAYDSVPQTFGAQTYAVIAPEHPLVKELVKGTKHEEPVMAFVEKLRQKKMANKFKVDAEMEGIFTGRYIENPFDTGDLPIWVASFVVAEYGSGIVNSSAHDERDFAFAKKYGIPLRPVMFPSDKNEEKKVRNLEYCYARDPEGIMEYPKEFNGRKWEEAREEIIDYCVKNGWGKRTTNYKLRDWLLSRQRYWGAPIPIIHCEKCGIVPVPEKDLPVVLPEEGVDYLPKGKAPLGSVPDFVNTKCPTCGGKAKREVDTMDTFVDSSWYFLRYLSPHDDKKPFDEKMNKQWMPVDLYIGGPEHACMHLLYARFIHKVLMNDRKAEPFKRLVHQGLITKAGAKMSKSKGNVVSPDAFVEKYGSDVFRMYLMFMGPFTDGGDWNDRGITGIARFLERLWNFMISDSAERDSDGVLRSLHATIKKVTGDIEVFHFNTALSAMMEFLNLAVKEKTSKKSKQLLCQIAAPFAPHFAQEAWEHLGFTSSVFEELWPKFEEKYLQAATFELVIQVNGKLRGRVTAPIGISQEKALEIALAQPNIPAYVKGKKRVKDVFVPDKLLNIVVA